MAEFAPLDFDGPGRIVQADNLRVLRALPDASVDLIYADPPFNTGRVQRRRTLRTRRDPQGGPAGFGGARYAREETGRMSYDDRGGDYLGWLRARLEEARRALAADGSLLLHLDYREVHYAKVMLDGIFGRACFLNEIIWAYDYGARSRKRWSPKHDSILWYARDPKRYTYRYEDIDRIPYLAPGLVSKEKAARGKTPTDVWWQTIVPTNGREKTGYPTQKPLAVLERFVRVHSNPGDLLLDFCAGSGSWGEAAAKHGRRFLLVDSNPEAVAVMEKRLASYGAAVAREED